MPAVRLGNVGVREVIGADHDGTPIHRRYTGQHTTEMTLPEDHEGWTHDERLRQVTHDDGHWNKHSSRPPAWIECDDADLQAALAEHWGCPVGEPTGWINHIEAV